MNVAVLGASTNPERHSHKAVSLLLENGHQVFPIHPKEEEILGLKIYSTLEEALKAASSIHTLSIYLRPEITTELHQEILNSPFKRVIFNPGTENTVLMQELDKKGGEVLEACTLVLLRTGQF